MAEVRGDSPTRNAVVVGVEWTDAPSTGRERESRPFIARPWGAEPSARALTEDWGGQVPTGRRLYVGLDVGRRQHMVAAIPGDRMAGDGWQRAPVKGFDSTAGGFAELETWLETFGVPVQQTVVGLEPSGGWYGRPVTEWLEARGYSVVWLQNWAVHERRTLLIGKQTKTDALDARLLARVLFEKDALGTTTSILIRPPRSVIALRLLLRNRLRLVEDRIRFRGQLTGIEDVLFPELKEFFTSSISGLVARAVLECYPTPRDLAQADPAEIRRQISRRTRNGPGPARIEELRRLAAASAGLTRDVEPIVLTQAWLLRRLATVDSDLAGLDVSLREVLSNWPSRELEVMESFPCMSPLREAVLLGAIGDIATYRDDRQLRKQLGWYPEARESGSSLAYYRLGSSGNRMARREIWLWCLQLLAPRQPDTPFRGAYRRLRSRGLVGRNAIGHMASKLVSVLFFCLRHGELYDAERHARSLERGMPAASS